MAKEPLTAAHEKTKIVSMSGCKWKKVEHGGWMPISSFKLIEALLVKKYMDTTSISRDYQCPILEQKLKDVEVARNSEEFL